MAIDAGQRGRNANPLGDGSHARDSAADYQAGRGVVYIGIGARCLLDHAVGGCSCQCGVFIDRTHVGNRHRRIIGAADGDSKRR